MGDSGFSSTIKGTFCNTEPSLLPPTIDFVTVQSRPIFVKFYGRFTDQNVHLGSKMSFARSGLARCLHLHASGFSVCRFCGCMVPIIL